MTFTTLDRCRQAHPPSPRPTQRRRPTTVVRRGLTHRCRAGGQHPPPHTHLQDIRAKPGGAGACAADLDIFCSDVSPGGGRRNRCLQDNIANLSPECKKIQENIMSREAKDATISPILKTKCFNEEKMFCTAEKEEAHDQLLTCLKANTEKEGFGDACKREVGRVTI